MRDFLPAARLANVVRKNGTTAAGASSAFLTSVYARAAAATLGPSSRQMPGAALDPKQHAVIDKALGTVDRIAL